MIDRKSFPHHVIALRRDRLVNTLVSGRRHVKLRELGPYDDEFDHTNLGALLLIQVMTAPVNSFLGAVGLNNTRASTRPYVAT